MGVQMKEYGGSVAEDIRALLVGRTLIYDRPETIKVVNRKKSRNTIDIYVNYQIYRILIIKRDKFIVNRPSPKWKSKEINERISDTHGGYVLNSLEELHNYIIETYL